MVALRDRLALTRTTVRDMDVNTDKHSTSAQVDSLAHKAKGNEDVSWRGQAERIRWEGRDDQPCRLSVYAT